MGINRAIFVIIVVNLQLILKSNGIFEWYMGKMAAFAA